MVRQLLAIAALVILAGRSARADCLAYEPAEVTLVGVLTMAHGHGPPGFGEDPKRDRKEEYGLLTLDRPVCVSGGTDSFDDEVDAIKAFQLVPDDRHHFDRHLLGSRVEVSGTLFHRVSGGHTES